MDWSWAVGGVTNETPRTMGPECENYMTNRRRWIEAVLFCIFFISVIKWASKRLEPIQLPDVQELEKPHSRTRLLLLILMSFIFGVEMGFKLANRSVIFALNPCHIQTLVQIYLLAAKPSKLSITLFRIQMNNLNGPFLAFLFPEVECRTLPFEQATYWIQHAMLYIIPVYIIRTGAYQVEDIKDFNWTIIGVETQLIYHFGVLSSISIWTGINLNHMLCAAESDPFQGDNYRVAAVIHESILCPILNKLTVLIFSTPKSIQFSSKTCKERQTKLITAHHHHQPQSQFTKLTSTVHEMEKPLTNETTYIQDDGTNTQLIHRKTNPLNYQQHYTTTLHELDQSGQSSKAVLKDNYTLDPDMDMEAIESSPSGYTMPTTKIE